MALTTCVIVPTINNPKELSIALDGLLMQNKKIDHIVVVGPKDDPGRLVQNLKIYVLLMIKVQGTGLMHVM